MRTSWAVLVAVVPCLASPICAHRLDEYLQAILVAVERDRLVLQVRLTPGITVAPKVLAAIDTDGDGDGDDFGRRGSGLRRAGAAGPVAGIGRNPLPLRLKSSAFPTTEAFIKGEGGIQFDFEADLPSGGPARRLILENRHQADIAVYLVYALVPRDPSIRVVAQDRSYNQSRYQLDFALDDAKGGDPSPVFPVGSEPQAVLTGDLAVVKTYFGSSGISVGEIGM